MARHPDPVKREKILNSAIALFLEKGYRDATVAEIAGNAGLVASNAYIYYENKEALLLAAMRRMMEEHTIFFSELSRKSMGLCERDYVNLIFDELAKIRPRILFMMHCAITPGLGELFEKFDFDYSGAFAPYFSGWPEAHAAPATRALMALSDSFFLVGDTASVKEAAVTLLTNARAALPAPTENEGGNSK
ncbi:TetR/AcrR family transcriptional regulator [Oscillospiraceae bacterium OttesenSCG-928-G22]|nr:TetR/AcrR family transcriptional regulator [Oscillospiraceae bacterium OttesenSCG-928-G22]